MLTSSSEFSYPYKASEALSRY